MKPFYLLVLWACMCVSATGYSQSVLSAGAAPGTLTLVPFVPTCFSNGSTSAIACGNTVTFNFTSFQISSCPNSGKMPAPGSVAFGGPGSSASFTNYHTLSYSPSNEHQQLVFSQPITVFQFSCSGPYGAGEVFSVQAYNGATLLGNHNFNVPGQGLNLTYFITAPAMTRIQFTEINAISADDELFGDFMIATPGCPLPVEMINATAEAIDNEKVRIEWETREELGMDHFEVQRSRDGKQWEAVGQAAAHNEPGPNQYALEDLDPMTGPGLYRIEMVGLDGERSYSSTMQVQIIRGSELQVQIWPNPAQSSVAIDFQGLAGLKEVELLTLLGQQVMSRQTEDNAMQLDLTGLERAIYLVRVRHGDNIATHKLAVQ